MKAPTVAWCTAWLLLFGLPAAAEDPGFDFSRVPTNLRPTTPRASWFGIAPTGPGYYSARDWLRGECRPVAPEYPFPPTVNASLSAFDLDTRYLDAPNFQKEWPDQLKRVRLGEHWMFSTGGQAWLRYENHTNSRLGTRDNIFLLDRARPYVDLWYEDRVRVFVEGMFASSN